MSTANSSRYSIQAAFQKRFGNRAQFDVPLASMLAYRVGGPAEILVYPEGEEDLTGLMELAKEHSLPITTIGTGTNLLVRDEGIQGITVSFAQGFRNISILREQNSTVVVRSGGGVLKPELLEWAVSRGFGGLEFSAGVPGTIGGGIFMNAGTKYGCYGDILSHLRVFDFVTGVREISRGDAHFGYREQTAVKNSIVLSVDLTLRRDDSIRLKTEVDRIIAERAAKQPLHLPSCGSTFKNPEGLSAGRLIEKANLKGLRIGDAQVSEKHANFILNLGNATASDILKLIEIVRERVYDQFGVKLENEVIVLGAE